MMGLCRLQWNITLTSTPIPEYKAVRLGMDGADMNTKIGRIRYNKLRF